MCKKNTLCVNCKSCTSRPVRDGDATKSDSDTIVLNMDSISSNTISGGSVESDKYTGKKLVFSQISF